MLSRPAVLQAVSLKRLFSRANEVKKLEEKRKKAAKGERRA
jgi:hypothetical protein